MRLLPSDAMLTGPGNIAGEVHELIWQDRGVFTRGPGI
ncbi:MAG: hypothetical protein A4E37_02183 [Methanoregulaceae archaeon PtaB.Bin056]|nr:MAG: hypothetical protein A4E37_02183 [Methanoregulaceae archaeon PtaB.Bin056]